MNMKHKYTYMLEQWLINSSTLMYDEIWNVTGSLKRSYTKAIRPAVLNMFF